MTLAAVGSPITPTVTGLTFPLTPSAVHDAGGDHFIEVEVISTTSADHPTALSSSNVTWDASPVAGPTVLGSVACTVFKGKVTAASLATVTVTMSAGTPTLRVLAVEGSSTAGYSSVTLDVSGTVNATTTLCPSLTPGHGAGEFYFYAGFNAGLSTAGSTSGYTYGADASGNGTCFDGSCGSGVQQPAFGASDTISGIAVLLYEAGAPVPVAAVTSAAYPLSPPAAVPPAAVTAAAYPLAPPAAIPVAAAVARALPLLPPGPQFPTVPLDLRCELNLGGTWTDVSGYVYQREGTSPPVNITRGRPDESSQANPSTCTWEWDNRDGQFSPKNPLSPYYGQLGRNTPVRWSVPAKTNYLRMENGSADRAFVNDDSAIGITGSIEMRIELKLTGWQGCILAGKWDGGGCWAWQLNPAGTMTFWWFDASVALHSVTSSQPVPFTPGTMALRVTMDASTGNVTFYSAPTIDGTYAQLGSVSSGTGGASTSIQVQHGSALLVGYSVDFTPGQLFGSVHEYRLYNGIGGTVAADAVFTSQAASATSWTDSAGNTWNLAGGAEISARNYRGHFEMSAQPPKWDVTGADQAVMAAAGGPLRRLSQGTANAMSAMKRAVLAQSGSLAPVAYWSMEDAAGASLFGAAAGARPMTFDLSPAPNLATDSSFLASAPLPTLNGSRLYGSVAPYASGGAAVVRWLTKLGTVTLLPGLTYAPLMRIATSGTVRALYVVAFAGGALGMIGYDSSGSTIVNTGALAFGAAGVPLWYSAEIQLVSGNVQVSLVTLAPGASSGLADTVTLSGGAVGNVTQVALNPNALFTDTVAGHVTLQSTWSTLFNLGQPLNAWTGETAGSRYARLAGENGYQARITGSPGQSALMGPQSAATLANLLTECEVADLGQAYEPRQQLAIGYRTLASMLGQSPEVTLDYSQSQPGGVNGNGADGGLDPTYDDLLLANDWTVTRGASGGSQGATWQAQLNDGSAMSISDPPAGAGDYAKTQTANVEYDSQLQDVAGWLVHTGTVDQARWPGIPVNLARTEIQGASLYYPVLDADVGDYLELTNLPDIVLYDPVRQLLFGTKESLGGFHHTMEWSAVPEIAYEAIVMDDAVHGTADTDGSTLASSVSSSATSLSVAIASGDPLWTTTAADFPFDIAVSGERMTVTNITGSSSPQSFTVTRAVNGVSKSQSSGADVRLWSAPILSLA
jgi:hypothetical protein